MSSTNAPVVAAAPAAPESDVPAVTAMAVSVEAQGAAPPGGIIGGISPAPAAAPPAGAKPVKQSRVQQQLQNLQLPDVIGPRTVIPGFTWVKRPKPTFERKCTYGKCPKPDESAHFFRIEEGRTAGGQDWTALIGMVLCEACYGQYKKRGTLERGGTKASLDPKRKRCTFDGCDKPEESSHFYLIEPGKTAGGRDWTPLVGNVLCHTCYCRWKNRGTFDRVLNRPVDPKLRTCSWKDCERPTESKSYAKIEPGKTTGGQDWSSLVGSVLCNACYKRFKDRGTLEKHNRGAGAGSSANAGANNPTTPKKQAAQALAGLAAAAAAAAQEDTNSKGKSKQAAKPAAAPASPAKAQKDAASAASPSAAKDAAAVPAAVAQAKTVDLGKQKVTVTVKPVVAKSKAGKVEAVAKTAKEPTEAASKAPASSAASGSKVGKTTTSKVSGAGGASGKAPAAAGTKRTAAAATLEAEGRDALAAAAAAAGATGKGKRARKGAAAGGEGPAGSQGQGKDITECVVM